MVASHALALVEAQTRAGGEWARSVEQVAAGRVDPYAHAAALVARAAAGEVGPVDHVGLATGSIADALAVFVGVLGLPAGPVEEIPAHEVRAQFIGTGPASIELIEPTAATSPVATFLRRRGPGLHHLALRVADLEGTLAALKARGLRLIDETGRPGARGARVAFVHPASTGGVLIELVAREGGDRADR